MEKRIDLAIGVLVVLFGAFVFVHSFSIRPIGPVVDAIGPRGFPIVFGLLFIGSGAAIVARRLIGWRTDPPSVVEAEGEPDEPGTPASALRALTLMGLTIAYLALLESAGYPIATLAYVVLGLLTMNVRAPVTVAATAIVYTAVTYWAFSSLVGVALPLGPLGR